MLRYITCLYVLFFILAAGLCPAAAAKDKTSSPQRAERYRLQYDAITITHLTPSASSARSDPPSSGSASPNTQTQQAGSNEQVAQMHVECILDVLNESARRMFVHLRSPQISVVVDGAERKKESSDLQQQLSFDCVLHLNEDRAIENVVLPSKLNELARGLSLALLTSLQGSYVAQRIVDTFTVRNAHDRLGVLRSHEQWALEGGKRMCMSLHRGYAVELREDAAPGAYIRQQNTVQGVQFSTYDKRSGRLLLREGCDTQVVRFASKPVIRSQNCAQLEFVKQLPWSASEPSTAVDTVELPERSSTEEVHRAAMQQIMSKHTIVGTLDSLRRLEVRDSALSQSIEPALRAAAYLHPEVCDSLAVFLRDLPSSDQRVLLICHVLAQSGHIRAQQILLDHLQSRENDESHVVHLIPELADVRIASELIVDRLAYYASKDPRSFVRSTAQLALASLVRSQRVAQPIVSALAYEHLMNTAPSMSSDQFLYVLGNAGDRRSVDTLMFFAASPDTNLAALALRSMRSIASTRVDSALAQALLIADSTLVAAALDALGYRLPRHYVVESLMDFIVRPSLSSLRTIASRQLIRWMRDIPCIDQEDCVQLWLYQRIHDEATSKADADTLQAVLNEAHQ